MGCFFILSSCEKDIEIDIPAGEVRLVVDGTIETNQPPLVFLTKSVPYFDPIDANTFGNLFVHGATVTVSNGTITENLTELCANDLPDSVLPIVAELTGLTEADLQTINYCVYTSLNPAIWGEIGKTYALTVDVEGEILTSTTSINAPIPLDSLWYNVFGGNDTLGFVWARLADPGGESNYYRWTAKRINNYSNGDQKDQNFVGPSNSVFDDQFFDGLEFDFAYDRGSINGSDKPDDQNDERGFFKTGDTVVIKFSHINQDVYKFIRQKETQLLTSGNPFAAPTSVPSNIEGGLGIWAGFSPVLDTVVCIE